MKNELTADSLGVRKFDWEKFFFLLQRNLILSKKILRNFSFETKKYQNEINSRKWNEMRWEKYMKREREKMKMRDQRMIRIRIESSRRRKIWTRENSWENFLHSLAQFFFLSFFLSFISFISFHFISLD